MASHKSGILLKNISGGFFSLFSKNKNTHPDILYRDGREINKMVCKTGIYLNYHPYTEESR